MGDGTSTPALNFDATAAQIKAALEERVAQRTLELDDAQRVAVAVDLGQFLARPPAQLEDLGAAGQRREQTASNALQRAKMTSATAIRPWPLEMPSFQLPG